MITAVEKTAMAAGRLILLTLLSVLLLGAPLAGQGQGTVTGRVFDSATEQPLPGVGVRIADLGTLTGADGRFLVTGVPAGDHTLRLELIGYRPDSRPITVEPGKTATVQIDLVPEAIALERLVVTGYGQRRAADVTGSVETVGEAQFNTGRVISPEELIQGKVAGLQVIETGEPGGPVQIRIRGGTSVNASNEPLFVLDGVPLPQGGGLSAGRNPLNFLNPDDIEGITVLKDAAATAIYGSRGANGVIMVETRSGSVREPQFTYSGSFSGSTPANQPDMLTAEQFRATVQAVAPERMQFLGEANTDWRGAVLRNATGQEHTVAVAGAGDDMNYRLSLGYLDQQGVVLGSNTERISVALGANQQLFNDRLSVRANVRGARTSDEFTPGGGLGAATVFDPTQPIRTDDGFFEQETFALAPNNPVAELELGLVDGTTFRSVSSLEAEYGLPFLESVKATARVGYDVATSERRTFFPSTLWGQQKSDNPGYLNRSSPRETTALLDAFLTYDTFVGPGNSVLDATAGYSYETSRGDYPFFEINGLDSDLLGPSGIPTFQEVVPRLSERENRLASFFARANYTLDDRYLLTVSVRRDGSSRFGPGNQWGTFPAAAVAWRISEESFMADNRAISDLKLRASWGVNGNQAIGDYLWAADYRYGDEFTQVQFGEDWITTIRPTAVDPSIRWEETTSYNVGLDYALSGNRFSGSIDYYFKDTDDLIFRIPVAAGTFLSNFVTTNIGSMRNQGLELSLDADVIQGRAGGFGWSAGFTAATNRNKLLTINPFGEGGEQILVGGIAGGVGSNIQVLQTGEAVNSFFVYRHQYDEAGRPISTGGPMAMYEDVNDDGRINQDDRVPFNSPNPTWMFGHTSRFQYGNAGLSFTMRAHLGNYVYNNLASSQGFYNRLLEAAGPVNLHKSVGETGFIDPQYFSDYYVEDASFLRMDNITLNYTLPRSRIGQELRLFGTVQNAFTLTGYSGVDPEAGLLGIDNNIYPRSRTFSTGVNVVF